ncbi:hypothetical protein SAVIM338S_00238 [Streptomyces avidinii]
MSETSIPGPGRRLTKTHQLSIAGVAALGAAALALSLAPAGAPGSETVMPGTGTRAARQQAAEDAGGRPAAAAPVYADNLNGWIKESLGIMKKHGIPGTYNGLYKNIMRESSGNPRAINGWDVNAKNGVPSIGLLQVIRPTFLAYHVPGTAKSQYNPVANIVAAANYAAARYGSIDNVHSAY